MKNLLKYFENIELILLHFSFHLNFFFLGLCHRPATRCRASWSKMKWKWAQIHGLGVVGWGWGVWERPSRTRERTRERVRRGQNWVHGKAPIRYPNQSNNNIQSVRHNNKRTLNLSFIWGCAYPGC
jgi:hypothetical protein